MQAHADAHTADGRIRRHSGVVCTVCRLLQLLPVKELEEGFCHVNIIQLSRAQRKVDDKQLASCEYHVTIQICALKFKINSYRKL